MIEILFSQHFQDVTSILHPFPAACPRFQLP